MKITLAKLMKEKNRMVKRMLDIQTTIKQYNMVSHSKEEEPNYKLDTTLLVSQLLELSKKLSKLKTYQHKANLPIIEKIFQMAELKNLIKYYKTIPYSEGYPSVGLVASIGSVNVTQSSQIGSLKISSLVQEAEKQIMILQDELDEYNASHKVEVEDDLITC